MKTYKQFNESLNEKNEKYLISLLDVEKVIKEVFADTKVSSVSSIYEKDEKTKELKLVITINNLFYEKTDIIHTKFIFLVDGQKRKLSKNKFFYLYDINCEFREIDFENIEDLKEKLNKIINSRDFGNDIKELSDIVITIASDVNKWFSENNKYDISIYTITYSPIVDNIPCESLSFKFEINVDGERIIELRLKKIDDKEYKFTFKEGDWFYDVEKTDIKGMVQVIGKTLKKYID